MKFRQAAFKDIDMMAEIRLSVVENVLSDPSKITRKMYEDYLDRRGRGWVCELDQKVVGFSYADREANSIWALFVLPEYEGIGVGKGLIQLATSWLFELGAKKVTLDTRANTRADIFYKSQGWTREDMKNEYEVTYSLLCAHMSKVNES